MRIGIWRSCLFVLATGTLVGCADSDNPLALADLDAVVEIEIEAARVETFEEVEMRVHISEGGAPLAMSHVELELSPPGEGATSIVTAEPSGDAFAAHVTFFEPGEHRVHVMGTPKNHRLSREMGEMEIEVHRRHLQVGPFWVELDVVPAPVLPNSEGHVHLLVYDLAGGAAGDPVPGLDIELEVHSPGGTETEVLVAEEESGEYEATFFFTSPGLYELHLGIDTDGQPVEGEFHLPVIDPDVDPDPAPGEGGGHGH